MPGPGGLSSSLAQNSAAQGNALYGQSQGIQSALTPFFQNEMYNPQGLGAQTMSSMMTQAGQSTAGALGGARQSAMDLGARTGNLAAIPQLIGQANKAGIGDMSGVANQIGLANADARMQQQQKGAAGLAGIMGQDMSGSLGYGKNENEAIQNLQAAQNSGFGHMLESGIAQAIPAAAGGMSKGIGEGLSTMMQQLGQNQGNG